MLSGDKLPALWKRAWPLRCAAEFPPVLSLELWTLPITGLRQSSLPPLGSGAVGRFFPHVLPTAALLNIPPGERSVVEGICSIQCFLSITWMYSSKVFKCSKVSKRTPCTLDRVSSVLGLHWRSRG